MRGYAFLDLDSNVVYKVADYIENHDPGFFSTNRPFILKHWQFDTSDIDSMWRMFRGMQDMAAQRESVNNFIKTINFDMNRLKDVNKVQSA